MLLFYLNHTIYRLNAVELIIKFGGDLITELLCEPIILLHENYIRNSSEGGERQEEETAYEERRNSKNDIER